MSVRVIQEIACILLCLPKDYAAYCSGYKDDNNQEMAFLRTSTMEYRYYRYVMESVVKYMQSTSYRKPTLFAHTPHELTTTFVGKIQLLVEQRNRLVQVSKLLQKKKEQLLSELTTGTQQDKNEALSTEDEETLKEDRRKRARQLLTKTNVVE